MIINSGEVKGKQKNIRRKGFIKKQEKLSVSFFISL